jgi:hypothetical protein
MILRITKTNLSLPHDCLDATNSPSLDVGSPLRVREWKVSLDSLPLDKDPSRGITERDSNLVFENYVTAMFHNASFFSF